MVTRRFSPPLIPLMRSLPMRLSAQSFKPIFRSMSSALCIFSCFVIHFGRRRPAAYRSVSRTVSEANRASSSWVTKEQIACTTSSEGARPLNVMFPDFLYLVVKSSRSRPAMVLSNVVFPDPDGPMMTFNVPG